MANIQVAFPEGALGIFYGENETVIPEHDSYWIGFPLEWDKKNDTRAGAYFDPTVHDLSKLSRGPSQDATYQI